VKILILRGLYEAILWAPPPLLNIRTFQAVIKDNSLKWSPQAVPTVLGAGLLISPPYYLH
jgi:hypothetical protein